MNRKRSVLPRIFRKLRFTLLKPSTKLKSLLGYLLLELGLVVAGILIAFKINVSNENVKLRKTETALLSGIRSDLLTYTLDLSINISGTKGAIRSDSILLYKLLNPQSNHDSEIAVLLHFNINSDWRLTLRRAHFLEARTKGLSIIENPKLRAKVLHMYEFTLPNAEHYINESAFYDFHTIINQGAKEYLAYGQAGYFFSENNYSLVLNDRHLTYCLKRSQNMKVSLLQDVYQPTLQEIKALALDIENYLEKRD